MTSIANVDVESDGPRPRSEQTAKEPPRSKGAPFIAMALMLLPLNAGILLYTAKNAADVRESSETLASLKLSIDGLKAQIDKQAHTIAKGAKADDMAIIRQHVESLQKDVADLDGRMRSGVFASGGAQILSAPGKEVTQYLEPSFGAVSVRRGIANDSLASIDAQGVSVSDLPRYERSVSPEGKLILRKVQ
ncbi:hypothetical protein [Pararhizobium sp. LjRoot238]|uniref:hypothetical protein n=1 Tax=Pararhizobium sp. LjRoot238 TaxID=3342293 RepID=UPI003ED0986D